MRSLSAASSRAAPPAPGKGIGIPLALEAWRLELTFAVAALLYLAPTPQSMARNILALAMSLVEHGSLELHAYAGVDVAVREGRTLSGMPPGASFLVAPLYLLSLPALRVLAAGDRLVALYVTSTIALGIPAAVLSIHLVYRTALRWGATGRDAWVTAALLAFGTMHFGYATGFYKKTLAAAFLLEAFVLLMPAGRDGPAAARAGLAGALCGLAVGLDYPTALIAAALGGYLFFRRPPGAALAAFAAGGTLALLPVLAYHRAAFGSPWLTAYHFRTDLAGNTLCGPRAGPFLFLLSTLLASSPCLVWSGIGWWRAVRTRERRAEMVTIAGIVLGMLLTFSGWASYYPHEASFASRLLLPMIPFAALPMAFGLPATLRGWPLLVIGWSVAATLLAAQASMIPTDAVAPLYAARVLATSWGAGPLFSETLASRLGFPTLHLLISRGVASSGALLQPEHRDLLLEALLGQALVKLLSLAATAVSAGLLWRFVWRPAIATPGGRASFDPAASGERS